MDGLYKALKFSSAVQTSTQFVAAAQSVQVARSESDMQSIGSIVVMWQYCTCSNERHPIPKKPVAQAVLPTELPPSRKFYEFGAVSTECDPVHPSKI